LSSAAPARSGPDAAAPANSSAANPAPTELASELQQLKQSLEAQARVFAEHSQELESERAALREQMQRIEGIEAKLGIPPDPSSPSGPASAAFVSTPTQAPQAQTPQDWSNRIGNLEDAVKHFGPFTLSGDFRLRSEPFFGGPTDHSLDRTRVRYRLRFNVDAKLNKDFSGGFSLGSGDVSDPTSTNQNVDGFYSRKPFFIDKAYVNYNPHAFSSLTLTGGKFAYPWYYTELTWDKDLNPEGVAQTLAFNLNTPVLKKIAVVGFELPFAQVARTAATNKSIVQSITYGAQLQTQWQLASWLKFGAFTGFYDFHNADPVALALAKASSKNPATPLVGALPLSTGNTVQNSIITTTATNVVTIGGTSYPTGVTTVTNAQFASKFALFDSLAHFDVKTASAKWPIAFIGDFVQNMGACSNLANIAPPPANTSTITYKQTTNFACDVRQRKGYWGEAQVGRAQQRGDWQFDYARIFIEREAVLSNFDYSELRQGSNVTEHRASVLYQVNRNVQLSFIGLIGRPLNFGNTKPPEPWLERLQFDVLYSF
jgi:putative porin